MLQTLFSIPAELFGLPMFGFGILLVAWLLFGAGLLAWSARRRGWGPETLAHLPVLFIVAAAIAFLSPNLVENGGLPIRGYGVMMLIGVVAGVGVAMQRAPAAGIAPDHILSLSFWLFAAGILGARAFHVIEYWNPLYRKVQPDGSIDWTATFKQIVNIPQGGLVVYGSLIAGTVVLLWFIRKNRLPGLALCDLIAPSMVLGLAFGRIGCLLNGCCFGGLCDLPWQVTFPQEAPPYERQIEKGLLFGLQIGESEEYIEAEGDRDGYYVPVIEWVRPASPAAEQGLEPGDEVVGFNGIERPTAQAIQHYLRNVHVTSISVKSRGESPRVLSASPPPPRSLPVHPTQIYSAINAMLICLLLLAYHPFRRRDGEVFALMLTIYPITRFVLEWIRIDEHGMFGTSLSISQWVSIVLLVGVAGFWVYLLRQPAGRLWADRAKSAAPSGTVSAGGR